MESDYRKQLSTVIFFHLLILSILLAFAFFFWSLVCGDGWKTCIGDGFDGPLWFLGFSILRPFLATPNLVLAMIAGDAYGPLVGTLLCATGVTLSTAILFFPAKYFGKIYVKPFLSANLPAVWRLIRTQDYKLVFFARALPIFPYDLFSILFGIADFRFKSVLIATFFGALPESYMFATLPTNPSFSLVTATLQNLLFLALIAFIPLGLFELIGRNRGSGLFARLAGVYRELLFELRSNNDIYDRRDFHSEKTPVVLLYGFFSSRRTLSILDRQLQTRGFDVMSFNLGGLFGVFFTRGIIETARFLDTKIRRQIARHKLKKVHIVAHSKGGLVALWWILKLGGYRYCDCVITMGTPFKGSYFTYLGLCTPLGFFWRDIWQMRPGSDFITDLHSLQIPSNVQINCFYSEKDRVCRGRGGFFHADHHMKNIHGVPIHHLGHFEFLYRKEVGEKIANILLEQEKTRKSPVDQAGKSSQIENESLEKKV